MPLVKRGGFLPQVVSIVARGLPFRCSGRASRSEIVAILESDFVPTALSLLMARR